ncbi:MAG: hypothetical protein V1918_02370 [Planctomycetota bacterium]
MNARRARQESIFRVLLDRPFFRGKMKQGWEKKEDALGTGPRRERNGRAPGWERAENSYGTSQGGKAMRALTILCIFWGMGAGLVQAADVMRTLSPAEADMLKRLIVAEERITEMEKTLNKQNQTILQLRAELGNLRTQQIFTGGIPGGVTGVITETGPVASASGEAENLQPDVDPAFDFRNAEKVIQEEVMRIEPYDAMTRGLLAERQRKALQVLLSGPPEDIPEAEFIKIRKKVYQQYPTNYDLRMELERQQYEYYRKYAPIR